MKAKNRKQNPRRPRAVSLFTGCGGSDIGLLEAGFDVVMANDVMRCAADTYAANLPETDYVLGDIRKVELFPSAELLVGCYPCQGYSQGGLRDQDRDINFLFREFARALKAIKPKAFIVENVSGLTRANFRPLLDEQVKAFGDVGFDVQFKVLNAADYGVPQDRKRVLIVGIRNDIDATYDFPQPTHGVGDGLMPYVTQRNAIGDLPEWPSGGYYARDFHWYYLSRDRYRGWEQTSKTILANPRHLPLHPASPPLIKLEHNKWRFAHEGEARRYTPQEAARLQGFGHDFVLPEELSLDNRYKVVGNAVPPPLMKAVASALPNIWAV